MRFRGKVSCTKVVIASVLLILILTCMFQLYGAELRYSHLFVTGAVGKDGIGQVCYRGENTTITVRMVNSTDPIVGELTLFYDEYNGLLIGGGYTNSSGYAVLHWGVPEDYHLGQTTIKASCPNRPDAIPVYADLFIKSKTNFENLTYPLSVYPGEKLVVEAILVDNNNSSIPNQRVYLKDYQNDSLNESFTDTLGRFSLSWEVPLDTPVGPWRFRVRFEENQSYASTEAEIIVNISPPPIMVKSITLNATRVEPNTPILVTVEVSEDNPLISVRINDYQLEKVGRTIWRGIIEASSQPGKYTLSVIIYYNGTTYVNGSNTCYIVEGEAQSFPAGVFLLFLTVENTDFTTELIVLAPVSAVAVVSAAITWKGRKRQPIFSRDYTLDANS